jgi:uncharacterized cysteine cluster protein YcgN (CxxCxxCC family)
MFVRDAAQANPDVVNYRVIMEGNDVFQRGELNGGYSIDHDAKEIVIRHHVLDEEDINDLFEADEPIDEE